MSCGVEFLKVIKNLSIDTFYQLRNKLLKHEPYP